MSRKSTTDDVLKTLVIAAAPALKSPIQDETAAALTMQAAGFFAIAAAIDRLTDLISREIKADRESTDAYRAELKAKEATS